MQQSRIRNEQRMLFTIANAARVNSAIRSYCPCNATQRDATRDVSSLLARVVYRPTGLSRPQGRQTRFPFIYFRYHFSDCRNPAPARPPPPLSAPGSPTRATTTPAFSQLRLTLIPGCTLIARSATRSARFCSCAGSSTPDRPSRTGLELQPRRRGCSVRVIARRASYEFRFGTARGLFSFPRQCDSTMNSKDTYATF